MVLSITDWLNELLTAGVTHLACTIGRDPQTGQPFFPHQPTGAVWLEHPEGSFR